MERHVVVVGAGISGLTCAYRLKQKGLRITVVEASRAPGGVIQTEMQEGFLCEAGPNSFQVGPEVRALVEELGLGGELITADHKLPRYIFYRGALHPAPMGPGALLSTRLLSWKGKLKVLGELRARPRSGGEEESLAQFVTRHFGPEVLRNLVGPLVAGIYAGDPERLSARSTFPVLVELEREYGSVLKGFVTSAWKQARKEGPRALCSFRLGMQALPRALAEKIGRENLLAHAETEAIRAAAGGAYTLRVRKDGEIREVAADAIVLATPACRAAELAEPLLPALARELAAIDYPSLAGICVSYRREDVPHPLRGFGFLAPRGEGVRLLGCIWNSSLFPERAPEGFILLTGFVGGSTDPGIASMSDTNLVETVREDLRATLGITAAPKVLALKRYERFIPQYTIGHEARLGRIALELKRLPGLFLTGNYLRGVSVGDCIRQAGALAAGL